MKVISKSRFAGLVLVAALVLPAVSASCQTLFPTVQDVLVRMESHDVKRRARFSGYTVLRRYEIVNGHRHAEMLVQLLCSPGGKKHFSILSENGSGAIRKHVFRKMLAEEENASDRGK